MLREAFEDLRPFFWPILLILALSLVAVPITLVTPLPVKILIDNVLGSQPLPGYLAFLTGSQTSKSYDLGLAIAILMGAQNRGFETHPPSPPQSGEGTTMST